MPQINMHTTPEFERDLFTVMAAMRLPSKSQAIRFALHEVAESLRDCEERRAALNGGSGASP